MPSESAAEIPYTAESQRDLYHAKWIAAHNFLHMLLSLESPFQPTWDEYLATQVRVDLDHGRADVVK